ncbi:hypothetical protein G6F66_015125 [Rhizopus arrhizus]|nr:hypothetical protein G6F68_015463 [Rhizopus microsporus]KAG1253336.1 hypothetical protein G6F66_015125 [Rhizopus arrhizus]
MAVRAPPQWPVHGLAARPGCVLGSHAEPATGREADDRPRLQQRRPDQPCLRPADAGGGGDGAGHRRALLLRVAAGRKGRRRPAQPAVRAPDPAGRRLPRSQPQR